MSTAEQSYVEDSTFSEKLIVASTGFGFACATFILTTLALIPATFFLTERLLAPEWLSAGLIFFEMFGLTAVAGVYGVVVAERGLNTQRQLEA